jgi:hypothetical protein
MQKEAEKVGREYGQAKITNDSKSLTYTIPSA